VRLRESDVTAKRKKMETKITIKITIKITSKMCPPAVYWST